LDDLDHGLNVIHGSQLSKCMAISHPPARPGVFIQPPLMGRWLGAAARTC
jgi:hypothetical protein